MVLVVFGLCFAFLSCGGGTPAADGGGAEAGPTLVATIPGSGAVNVTGPLNLTATFSKPVAAASLNLSLNPGVVVPAPSMSDDGSEVTWAALEVMPGTSYTVTLAAADAEGRAFTGQTTFTTAASVDTSPPTLTGSTPSSGAMAVVTTTAIALVFSEAMDQGSVLVSIEPSVDLGAPSWNAAGTQLTFPSFMGALDAKTAYELQLSGGDLAGNALAATRIGFTTAAPPDVTPPTVDSSAPGSQAMGVPVNAALSLSFSEPMDQASVNAAFSISPAVAGVALWDGSGMLRSFQPSAPLAAATMYTVTLTTAARDLASNPLAQPFSFSFTTSAAPDTTAPSLTSSTPAAGAMGVGRAGLVTLVFSEPMDKAATQAAFNITAPAQANVGVFSWSPDGKAMTFTPQASFDYGTAVAWRLTTSARDLAGNTIGAQVSRGFIVIRQGVAVLDSVMGVDGYVTNGGFVSTTGATILFGDSSQNVAYRGFLSFDLSGLPATLSAIKSAQVYLYLASVAGAPTATLGGGPRIEHVDLGPSLDVTDYDRATIPGAAEYSALSASTTPGWKANSVILGAVEMDWQGRAMNGARTQYRLRFPNQVSANSTADYFSMYSGNSNAVSCPRLNTNASGNSCKPHLVVVYEYP